MEITLKDLWFVLKKSFLVVLIGALIVGAAFFVYTKVAVQKVYRSSSEYILVLKDPSILHSQSQTNQSELTAVNNYLVVGGKTIKTLSSYLMNEKTRAHVLRYVEQRHAQEPENPDFILDHTYTASSFSYSFTVPEEETDLVFKVSCNAYSPKDARILMDAFGAVINERSEKVLMDVFSVEVSDDGPKDGSLVSPNSTRNALLGAVIGAVVPYIICLLYTIFDTRIKKEEDLRARFSYPTLGQIPRI